MRKGLMALVALPVVVALTPVACVPTKPAQREPIPKLLDYAKNIGFIQGHLRAALANLDEGGGLAKAHAEHPLEEGHFSAIEGPLEKRDSALKSKIEKKLKKLPEAAAQRKTSEIEETSRLFEEALDVLVPREVQKELTFQAQVITDLLEAAEHEYEEAVSSEGKIIDEEEYQDAFGFFHQAKTVYEKQSKAVKVKAAHEHEEIVELLEDLEKVFATVIPPASPALPDKVKTWAKGIIHELAEVTGIEVAEEIEPEEAVENIRKHLSQIIQLYEAGKTQEAKESATKMYFDNYEPIEGEVIKKAPKLNEELEPLLGTRFRARIDAKAPVSEIKSSAERANELLDEVLKVLEE